MTNPAVHDSSASGGTDTLPAAIGCRPVNRWLPWGVGVGVILLGAALVWTWPELAARSSLDLEGPLVAQALPSPDGLYVFAAISRSSIARGSHQFLTVFLANRSAARIESLHLRILVPTGFEIPDASVIDAAVNKPLLPGGGRRITASLVAQKLGRFQLTIAVEWRDAKHGVSGTTISLKPVVVINPYMRATARVLSGFVGLFKDLGLPIVAALFAWWLKRRDDTRQLQQAAQQRLDEERRHEAETERARIQETWNLMLPITHQYNGKYYVRLVGAADRFARRAAECKPVDDPRCLYLLLTMLRQVRRITLEVGGLFLKNWRAEEVVKEAWEAFDRCLKKKLELRSLEAVLRRMDPDEDYATFADRFAAGSAEERSALEKLTRDYRGWAEDGLASDLSLMVFFATVFQIELNRPYRYWYEPAVEFPRAEFEAAKEKIQAHPEAEALKAKLAEYEETGPDRALSVRSQSVLP